ncbi:MAG TPA: hypothetical protein VIR77_03780 [Pontiella sp.]
MLNAKEAALALLTACVSSIWASQLTFDDLPLNAPPPEITADGVTVTFEGLITIAEHSSEYGFGGGAGDNTVYKTNAVPFGGRFLVNEGFAKAEHGPAGLVRTIRFSRAVTAVSMTVADIDAGEGVTIEALDATNRVIRSLVYPASTDADSKALSITFGNLTDIRSIRITGDDPIGIDHLSFSPAEAPPECPPSS